MKQLYILKAFIAGLLFTTAGYAQCTPPAITGTTSPTEPICAGTSATFTATSDSGTLAWFNAATGGTQVGTGGTFNSPPLSGPTSYWVEAQGELIIGTPQSGGGKTTHGNSGSAVNSASNPWGLVFNATQPFILNSVEVYLTSGTPGDIVVQLKDSNFNIIETTTVSAPAGGTSSNPVTFVIPLNYEIPVGTGYRLVADSGPAMIRDFASGVTFPYPIGTVGSITQGTINDSNTSNAGLYYLFYNWNFTPYTPCASAREQVTANVNVTPQPTASTQIFCGATTVAELEATGTDVKWYTGSTGGTELADATAINSNGTYYVSQTIGGCESLRTPVTVTINTVPAAPAASAQSFCSSGTVSELTASGTNLQWYADDTTETPLTDDIALATATYYVSQSNAACESARTAVSVTIVTPPAAPLANPQSFCGSATAGQLMADGDNLEWYTTEDAVNSIADDTPLSTHTYYVSQTVGNCESPRTAVSVTINDLPEPPAIEFISLCNTNTVGDLEGEGELLWYADATGGTPLNDEQIVITGTYYVSQIVDGCESTRAEVALNVEIVPEPGADPVQSFTAGETLADLEVVGENFIWYAADGVTPLDSSTPLEDGATYWVSQTINGCESSKTQITVNEVLSVDENTLTGLKAYPNPTTDKIIFSYSAPIQAVSVYNLLGQKMDGAIFTSNNAILDLSRLSAGTYIIVVTSGDLTANVKVIKE